MAVLVKRYLKLSILATEIVERSMPSFASEDEYVSGGVRDDTKTWIGRAD